MSIGSAPNGCGVTRRRKPGEVLWAVYRQNLDGSEPRYYLSNAPPDASLETLAYVGGSRWRIETEFETEKSDVGLDEYETRTPYQVRGRPWPGCCGRSPPAACVICSPTRATTFSVANVNGGGGHGRVSGGGIAGAISAGKGCAITANIRVATLDIENGLSVDLSSRFHLDMQDASTLPIFGCNVYGRNARTSRCSERVSG